MKTTFFLVASSALVLFGAGCSPAPASNSAPKTSNSAPQNRDMKVVAEFELPANFPTDIPKYTGSKTFSAFADEKQAILSLTSDDEASAILAWYRQSFSAMGATPGEKGTRGNSTSEAFIKGDLTFVVTVIDQGSSKPKSLVSVRREVKQPVE